MAISSCRYRGIEVLRALLLLDSLTRESISAVFFALSGENLILCFERLVLGQ